MSLRVWLPLNGDLRNNGLDNIEVVNNGATVDSSGKIGKCYNFNGSSQYLRIDSKVINTSEYSISFWMYAINTSSNHCIFSTRNTTSGAVNIYQLPAGIRFDVGSTCWTTGFKPNANTWYHIICVQDSTNEYLYVNGELNNSRVGTTILSQVSSICTIGCEHINGSSIGTYFNGKLNDIRIYDHALSAKEVKELSKGLVCHYPLNSPYIEGTTNLVTTEDCLSATCYNGATGKYGYGTNTDMYKVVGNFQGKKCTKLYMGTSGLSARPYPYIANLFVSNGTNQPEYKTLSFDYYATIGTYINPYKLGSGSATCNWTNDSSDIKNGTFTNSGNIPIVTNKWQHITMTLHGTTDANAEWGYIIMGDAHTSDVSNYWLFANMQIETKDHPTGYAGVGGTRDETKIIDSSGYGNNGQVWKYDSTGSIEITSNSPRNNVATYVNSENNTTNTASGTVYIYGNCPLTTPNYLTISFWCKPLGGYGGGQTGQGQFCTTSNDIGANAGSDYSTTAMHNRDNYIDMCTSTNIHKTPTISFTRDEWHHYVIVYDGRYGKIYKDTIQISNCDMGDNLSLASFKAIVIGFSKAGGVWRSNKSYYSDFRLYSTALSEEDIKELYNVSASIDKNGNVFAYEFKEG